MKIHSRIHDRRGSLLIAAMILAAVIGISLASYLTLGRTAMGISNRAFYNNGAMNLAENGLEQAMFAINKARADATFDWAANGWTISGADAYQKWTGYTFDQGATGSFRARIVGYNTSNAPTILTRSTVQLGGSGGAAIEKWIQVQLRSTSKFANGLVAKESVLFKGNNASVDSWNSDPDKDDATAPVQYSAGSKNDNGSVGSISVAVDAILVKNADIWGFAATGAAAPQVGPNGTIGPFGTPTGTVAPNSVRTDFAASFDAVTAPTTGTTIAPITNGDLPMTLGTAGTSTELRLSSLSSNGNSSHVLTIQGDVTLTFTATAGNDAISIGGSASIYIAPGASLTIFAEGDISIGGNGIANGGTTTGTANQPKNLQIWGTHKTTGSQDIDIRGNGVLSGIVYAPNANVTINGNGDVMGSVVAKNITLTGEALFHYDESLADMDAGNPYRVSLWKELTTVGERNDKAPSLSF